MGKIQSCDAKDTHGRWLAPEPLASQELILGGAHRLRARRFYLVSRCSGTGARLERRGAGCLDGAKVAFRAAWQRRP